MSRDAAVQKDALARRALAALDAVAESSKAAPPLAFWVPGRIEFVGKHTDYAGGRSIVCAVEQGIVLATRRREDRVIRICDATTAETAELALERDASARRGHWSNYPATVARRIARNFPSASRGADIAFASDLPAAAGMSSSSALVTATFLALSRVNDLPSAPEYRAAIRSESDVAAYVGTIENGLAFGQLEGEAGVGTFGGSEDHVAILCGTAGALTQFAFAPLRTERVIPLPLGCSFVVASSGVAAEKTGAALEAYNRVSHRAAEALDWLRASGGVAYPTLAAAVEGIGADALVELPDELRPRAEQFARESTIIVPRVGDALERHDLTSLGALVDRSQHLAERLLRNQVPETIFLAGKARELGAAAASAFGAGFGGSVWALVRDEDARAFAERWRGAYASAFPARASDAKFFTTRAGPHARALDLT